MAAAAVEGTRWQALPGILPREEPAASSVLGEWSYCALSGHLTQPCVVCPFLTTVCAATDFKCLKLHEVGS